VAHVARPPLSGPSDPPAGAPASGTDVEGRRGRLLRRGLGYESATLGWNVVGTGVMLAAAVVTGSVALSGFGVDSLIEIGASLVVVRQLVSPTADEAVALRLIGAAFVALAVYLAVQAGFALASHAEPARSPVAIAWLAATVVVMVALAVGKARTGAALGHSVLSAEARVTAVDAVLAAAVLAGVVADAGLGWWWADPLAGLVIVGYAVVEARSLLSLEAGA
jgi:divalent metal cation (Fe/Co/Zn/Cd) transporter